MSYVIFALEPSFLNLRHLHVHIAFYSRIIRKNQSKIDLPVAETFCHPHSFFDQVLRFKQL